MKLKEIEYEQQIYRLVKVWACYQVNHFIVLSLNPQLLCSKSIGSKIYIQLRRKIRLIGDLLENNVKEQLR